MLRATQSEQIGFGMKMSEMIHMMTVATQVDWIVMVRTYVYCGQTDVEVVNTVHVVLHR